VQRRITRASYQQFLEEHAHEFHEVGEVGRKFLARFFPGHDNPDISEADHLHILTDHLEAHYVENPSDSDIRYLHVREMDDEGYIYNNGGVTVAYKVGPEVIVLAAVKLNPNEQFQFAKGREYAKRRLDNAASDPGVADIIDIAHPITETIIDWVATVYWPSLPESQGGGYVIDIGQDHKKRWMSNFAPF